MASSRTRYVRIAMAEESKTNLMGGTVVGQFGTTLLVQRPDAKPRDRKGTVPRTRKAKVAVDARPVEVAEASRG